jgi:quercetin dioxygenase-like cupin family protein
VQALNAVAVATGNGEARWWSGTLAEIKATAADTGGQFTLVEVTCPPNFKGARHVHHMEDEAFWLLNGHMDLEVGGKQVDLNPGGYAFGPRNIPHSFTTGDAGCRVLFIMTPGGFENLLLQVSEPALTRTVPPPSNKKPDLARLQKIVARYGNEILV